jgi:hypothetical protein
MPERYASYSTREKLQGPVNEMTEIKDNSYLYQQINKKEEFERNYQKRKAVLEAVTPPDTTDSEKDKIKKRIAKLSEALINGDERYVPPMPSEQQMMKSPTGSVDQHMRWESFWKKHNIDDNGKIVRVDKGGRGGVYEWKDLRRVIAKGFEEESPNYANVEMLRPTTSGTPLADTHLPVSYGLSTAAKVHYEEVFPDHEKTIVEQKIEMAEKERLQKIADGLANELEKREKSKKTRKPRDLSNYDGPRCKAIRKDGKECGQPCIEGKDHCFSRFHRDQLAAKAAEDTQEPIAS